MRKQQNKNNNLVNLRDRPPEERQRISRMGAEASRAKRARQRNTKECFEILLSCQGNESNRKQIAVSFGVSSDEVDVRMCLAVAMVNAAMNGDVKAFEMIRNTVGEDPGNRLALAGEIAHEHKLAPAVAELLEKLKQKNE